MATQKKGLKTKVKAKKHTSKITVKHQGNKLNKTPKSVEPEVTVNQPQPMALDHRNKTAFMVNMLSRPEGATLKEMAEALGWKENSIRGAMSLYAKNTKQTVTSEKKDGIRTYYLKSNA